MNSLIDIPVESCIDCYPIESFILSCSPCVRPLRPLNGSIGCGQDPVECIGITIDGYCIVSSKGRDYVKYEIIQISMGNSASQIQSPTVIVNPEFPFSVTAPFAEILKDPSKAKTWVERQVERERERDLYTRSIAESKTVADVTRDTLDTIKSVELFHIEKSQDAIMAKENLEKCLALGKPLNCSDQVNEFKKIASSF